VTEVKRAEDNTFKCKCGKIFKLPDSLRTHARICGDELIKQEEDEREAELMDVDDSDASESLKLDDRIVPADFFGQPNQASQHVTGFGFEQASWIILTFIVQLF
jgi:hypothetical protein